MIIIPKENPILQNINSYYIDLPKLLEHCQGEFGTSCIHFKSKKAEAATFFDKDEIVGSTYKNTKEEIRGPGSVNRILEEVAKDNFTINIYKIDPEMLYFWANISAAEEVYSSLSSEFTDLEALIKKMKKEGLTGYIEANIGSGQDYGALFFNHGELIGGSYSWAEPGLDNSQEQRSLLMQKCKDSGGFFNVKKINFPEKAEQTEKGTSRGLSPDVIPMLEALLSALEDIIKKDRSIKAQFPTILKKKFMEKTSTYDFLDPFVAEFKYENGKAEFTGDAEEGRLVKGVAESVYEIAMELGLFDTLKEKLAPWEKKYKNNIERFEIFFR